MKPRQVSFGDLRIGPTARKYIDRALNKNWISEGDNVAEFEQRFAEKFQWKHAIATSSGTDAGIVVWSAIRELTDADFGHQTVLTPACAFVSTANCLMAAGMRPNFVDVSLETLNLDPICLVEKIKSTAISASYYPQVGDIGIQFVATMGKPTPIGQISAIADEHDLYLVNDTCEAHGAKLLGGRQYADHYADASIYSFYCAHLIVAGEGGMICTDNDEIADLCRSIKSHGRPAGAHYFDFKRVGFNSKWNELCAAIGLEGLEQFDENFAKRRENRAKLMAAFDAFKDHLIIYPDELGEIISPHAFCITLRDGQGDIQPLYRHMEQRGIQVKLTFGSLPTQHKAFEFLGHKLGEFPNAERIGRTSLHFSCSQFLTDEDIDYIGATIRSFCLDNA